MERFGILEPLHGGHQSRVYRVRSGPVFKIVSADTSRTELLERVRMLRLLARSSPLVCAPVPVDGAWVTDVVEPELGAGHLVAYEHADGAAPEPLDAPGDAHAMGEVLAHLHATMAGLPPFDLPSHRLATAAAASGRQLLHGDFGAPNLRRTSDGWRVFDFDDTGYGRVEHDVANALYLIRFDAALVDRSATAATAAFVAGYGSTARRSLDPRVLASIVDDRVALLASWLDDPTSAPPGVAASSPEWKRTLQRFVSTHGHGRT